MSPSIAEAYWDENSEGDAEWDKFEEEGEDAAAVGASGASPCRAPTAPRMLVPALLLVLGSLVISTN